jgi:iron complex outermembrane receptor protein
MYSTSRPIRRGAALWTILALSSGVACAQEAVKFHLPSQSLAAALRAVAGQTHTNILFDKNEVTGVTVNALNAELNLEQALDQLLAGTGLTFKKTDEKTVIIVRPTDPSNRSTAYSSASSAPIGSASGLAGPSSDDGSDSPKLEEIVVTARRREESISTVPVAITALSAQDIRARNIQTAEDLQNFVPSLNVSSSVTRDDYTFSLRGMGPTGGSGPGAVLAGGGTGVVTYFAEVPAAGTGPGLFYDLENVQVAEGPQGTLFGKNTTGGVVLFVPQKPVNNLEGSVEIGGGDYAMKTATAVVNVPVIDDILLVRVAGQFLDRDGFTIDRGPLYPGKDYDDRDYWALRLSIVFRPFEGVENYTIISALHSDENGDGFVLSAVNPAGAFAGQLLPILSQQQAAGVRSTALSDGEIDRRYNYGIINTTRWSITDQFQFKNIFSYQIQKWRNAEDVDGTTLVLDDLVAPRTGGWHTQLGTYTEEPQLQGALFDGNLKLTAGAYYEDGHNLATQPYEVDVAEGGFIIDQVNQTNFERSRGLYGQTTLDLGQLSAPLKGLKLTTGYRYTWDDYAYGIGSYSPSTGNGCLTSDGTYPQSSCFFSSSGNSDGASWTLGLDYQLPGVLLYIRSGRGYVPGGFNPSFGFTPGGVNTPQFQFAPESVIDVEAGIKSELTFLGMPTQLSADVFHSDFKNIQRYVSEVLPGGVESNFTANASEAEIEGFEFQGNVAATKSLRLAATYSYNYGKYTRIDPAAAPSLVGVPFSYLPTNKASVSATYTMPLPTEIGDVSLGAFYSYQSRFFDAPAVQPLDYIAAYGLLNARLDWNNIWRTDFDASVFVANATDKTYRVGQYSGYVANGYITSFYGEPRMFGVQLRYRFGAAK